MTLQKIQNGHQLVEQLQKGEVPSDRKCSTEDLSNIMYYLQACADAKAGKAKANAVSVPDPGNRIRAFLDTCPKGVGGVSLKGGVMLPAKKRTWQAIDLHADENSMTRLPRGMARLLCP